MTFDGGLTTYLVIAAIALIAHESWRWLGLWLAADIAVDGDVFAWVQYVANALVAGLVMRLVVFPGGALAAIPIEARLGALAIGIFVFFATGRVLAAGVASASISLLVLNASLAAA